MQTSSGSQAQINVTPLIDVLLVLLIIFMVIVPEKSAGLAAKVPQLANATDPPETQSRDIVLAIAEDRSVTINTQLVDRADLARRLRLIFAQRANGVLFVRGSGSLAFADVANVIDIARGAGVAQVGLIR